MSLKFVLLISNLCFVCGNILCPGSPESSYGHGQLPCSPPLCLVAGGGGLFPSPDPTRYFVCAGLDWGVEMRCAPGTCFSLQIQGCVHHEDWKDVCNRSEESIVNPSSTVSTDSTTPAVTAQDATITTEATTAFDWGSEITETTTMAKSTISNNDNDLYRYCRPILSNEEECLDIM